MVSEIQFLRDQIHARIRSLFMLKSGNGDNDDFSYNSRNIKNTVDNANKNVTPRVFSRVIFKCNPSSAYINFQKFSKDSKFKVIIITLRLQIFLIETISMNSPSVPKFVLTKILSLHNLPCMADAKIKTPQNVMSET